MRILNRVVVIGLAAFTLASTGAVAASASSQPGESLYTLKQSLEQAQVALTLSDSGQQTLQQQLWAQQSAEIAAAAQAGRAVQVSFDGELQQVQGSTWQVSGLAVQVTPKAVVVGSPSVGSNVKVNAVLPGNGSILVHRVEIIERSHLQSISPLPTPNPTHEPDDKHDKDKQDQKDKDKGDDHGKDKHDDGNKDKGDDHGNTHEDDGNHGDKHVTPVATPDTKKPRVQQTPQPSHDDGNKGDKPTVGTVADHQNNGTNATNQGDPTKHGRGH